MAKISECPSCGKMIYSHAAMCPYCKKKTGFPPAPAPVEQSKPQPAPAHGKAKTVKSFVRQRKYKTATYVKAAIIALLAITVLILYINVQMMNRRQLSLGSTFDHTTREVIDSMANEVLQTGIVVAKFYERDRHSLIYLEEGRLYEFDAYTRDSKELKLEEHNPAAVVDYTGSGILQANISPDESFIVIMASRNTGNTECGLYRMDAKSKAVSVIDRGKVIFENNEYRVESGGRVARYDMEGTKLAGLTIEEAEALPKPKPVTEKKEETTETQQEDKPTESMVEHLQPDQVDIVKKVVAPSEIKISPNVVPEVPTVPVQNK